MLHEGQILDATYHLGRRIGEGGMGTVFEATHARLAGRYAIKALLHQLSGDPEALARFEREARITSSLQHPNVVQVIDHNTTEDGTEYLVMEYLAGESLAERLARGPLSSSQAVEIVQQIAAGLAAAHNHGIVHRDLKPENIILVPIEGHDTELVKILDFGISKINDASWEAEAPEPALVGTPLYMAPEQIEGRPQDVDAKTDQFALATMAYELLTGRNPFCSDSVAVVFANVLRKNPTPTGLGRRLDAVLFRGMAKAKARRFPSVTDFAQALAAAANSDATSGARAQMLLPTEDGMVAASWRQRRSRPRRFGMALVAAAAATISLAFAVEGTARRKVAPVAAPSPVMALAPEPAPMPPAAPPQNTQEDAPEVRPVAAASPSLADPVRVHRPPSRPSRPSGNDRTARGRNGQRELPALLPVPSLLDAPVTPEGGDSTMSLSASRNDGVSPARLVAPMGGRTRAMGRAVDPDATLPLDETITPPR